ncbi:MAG: HAMP domain-containing protein [Desulfobacteraceae bacterium]|nr:HAMP domain-containing protein [Desulfobacteraceae bacterium]
MFKTKKLIWQIFPSFLIITLVSLAIVTWYSSAFFKNFFLENVEKDLTIRLKLAERELSKLIVPPFNEKQIKNLNALCKEIGTQSDTRFTIIQVTGKVIGDSGADITKLENHSSRPEIYIALKGEKGISIRYSDTLNKNMMYIALPIFKKNEIVAVIRASLSISTIDKKIKSMQKHIFLALALTLIIAAGVSLYVSRRITRPLEEMKIGAQNFAKGNLQQRLPVPDSEELGELASTMNNMAANLDDRIKAVENRRLELEAIHSSMEEGVIAIDKNEKIITINKAAASIFNFPISTLEQNNIYEVSRDINLQQFIKKALSTNKPVEKILTIHKNKKHVLNIHSTALYDSNNNRMGTLIIFHDITRIKLLENMHKDFAANVSHELKTPLTAIKGFVETLQDMSNDPDSEKNKKFLRIIEKNVTRMTAITNDLLSLSQLEIMQNDDMDFKTYDIIPIIDKAILECQDISNQKKITINKNYPDQLMAAVDPFLIEQTIINLIDNAVKYSYANTEISITALENNKHAIIRIKDSGVGIKKEDLSKIFNRFYRVDKARSRDTGGTGLGLAIVKHIAMYHNGSADVTSSIGKGSTFEIRLPLN